MARAWWLGLGAVVAAAVGSASGCESSDGSLLPPAGSGGGTLFNTGGDGPCFALECQQVDCPAGQTTSVSGTVYAPEGTLPLYNVLVYVPNAPLDPIPDGASCDQCGSVSGDPLVAVLTDTAGRFTLEDVPVGDNIPLVIQIGKWRKEITLPTVAECVDTPLTDPGTTKLPSNQGEGHIPKIALTAGSADSLECLLLKVGLDPAEFTLSNGDGRVNLYAGANGTNQYNGSMAGGAPFESAQGQLWNDLASLMRYDLVLLSCEGGQELGQKPMNARQAMHDYASAGGRIFMSHWHNGWLEQGAGQWPTVANWDFQDDPPMPYTGIVDQSFPKGQAMAEWLVNVGGSTTLGELDITEPQHTLTTVNSPVQQWIYGEAPDTGSVKYFSFNAPLGAADEDLCGRVVFSDIHVSSGDDSGPAYPTGCTSMGLTPQEKALIFMLFDLSACITPDDEPPVPPVD